MKPARISTLLLLIFFCVHPFSGNADKVPVYVWASAGAGGTAVRNNRPELSAGFSGNISRNKQLLGARFLFNEEMVIFRTPLKTNEIGIYYGRYFLNEANNAYAALGAGFSYEIYYTYGEQYFPPNSNLGTYHLLVPNHAPGLALDAQAGANFGRFFSFGAHAFASINMGRTIGGILLSVRLGYLGQK